MLSLFILTSLADFVFQGMGDFLSEMAVMMSQAKSDVSVTLIISLSSPFRLLMTP